MRWIVIIMAVVALGAGVLATRSRAAHGGGAAEVKATVTWMESYPDALAKAKTTGRPILVDFTGSDWCDWCMRLKDEVFTTRTFKDWAEANVILLELDFPQGKPQSAELQRQNDELAKKFSVEGFPTVLVLNAEGAKLGQLGYESGGPQAWIAALKAAAGLK
jgi:thioredoxin-related protein